MKCACSWKQIEDLQNKIDFCEGKINQIVYQLYELNDEEIRIVENDLLWLKNSINIQNW